MRRTIFSRHTGRSLAGALALTLGLSAIPLTPLGAQAPAKAPVEGKPWVLPRTPDGQPDLQGNWSNETQTPLERMGNQGPTLTDEQAAALETRAQDVQEFRDRPTDPGEIATKGGGSELAAVPGEPTFVERIAQAAGGAVGGYNGFWLDPGNKVIRIDGVARSSIIVDPPDGRIPALTAEAKQRTAERMALAKKFGEFDHPEVRPLAERCIVSFGSNAGPPMLPNYFYNNNYTIVQTKDHVMVMTEMVHDVRIIRLGATDHVPSPVRPWFGDSIGHWEGDTLVVETTNIHPTQLAQSGFSPYRGGSDKLTVTERFTRTGPDVLLYKFTVEDPSTFTAPYSGELPFNRINEMIHEYACHEGNYALPGMLAGAREQERAQTEQKKQ
jgi:hypothetical protein